MPYYNRVLAGLLGCSILSPTGAFAITITETQDQFALANTLFLNLSDSLQINAGNVNLSGALGQAGIYQNAAGTYGLPNAGIVLSSGNVSDYATGPNLNTGTTTAYSDFFDEGGGGDTSDGGNGDDEIFGTATPEQVAILEPISGQSDFFDVVQLDIEFFATTAANNVTFFATFGSEEFPEFANTGVNDGFGLIVNGQNVAGVTPTGGGANQPVNIDNPDFVEFEGTELDGVLAPNGNPVLQFDVPILPGEINNFTVILADAGDDVVDTTVYLSSFFAQPGTGDDGPSQTGTTEFDPLLPSNPPDPITGEFVIELPVDIEDNVLIWLDPPVSVGFEYEIIGDGTVATIQAPSFATVADLDGYTITANGIVASIASGAVFEFESSIYGDVTSFTLSGIDESLMLDPANNLAFPLGFSFVGANGNTQVSMTPITVDVGGPDPIGAVPLPTSSLLLGSGLFLAGGFARRKSRKKAKQV